MTYVLTISIILHLITFLWIIILTQKVNNQSELASKSEKIKSEIEDLLVAYTTEMKEDNENILNEISRLKRRNNITPPPLSTIPVQGHDVSLVSNQIVKEPSENEGVKIKDNRAAMEEEFEPPIDQVKDTFEQSKTAQVLMLSKEGYSAKEIAKKLDMGDGEVELLLKFYQ